MIKNIKVTLLILIIPLVVDMMIACHPSVSDISYTGGHYTNVGIFVNNLDNSGKEAVATISDSIPRQAYGFRLHLIREKLAVNNSPQYLFSQSVYADNLSSNYYNSDCYPIDSIVSFKIFTGYDFDSTHPANADVSDYFKVCDGNSFITVKDYFSFTSWVYPAYELQTDIEILLMTTPTINTRHQFKIQVKLSDGRVLEQATPIVHLI